MSPQFSPSSICLVLTFVFAGFVRISSCEGGTQRTSPTQTRSGPLRTIRAPSLYTPRRGRNLRRDEASADTCGFISDDPGLPVTCSTGVCVTSFAPDSSFAGCCGSVGDDWGECGIFTTCVDDIAVTSRVTGGPDPRVLTCPLSLPCNTYWWIGGALSFGCGTPFPPSSSETDPFETVHIVFDPTISTITSGPSWTSTGRTTRPTGGVPSPTQSTPPGNGDSSDGAADVSTFSAGAKVGVAVGCGSVFLAVVAGLVFVCHARRRKKRMLMCRKRRNEEYIYTTGPGVTEFKG